jgi:hypothetical protein
MEAFASSDPALGASERRTGAPPWAGLGNKLGASFPCNRGKEWTWSSASYCGASCIGYIFRLGAFPGVGEPEGDGIVSGRLADGATAIRFSWTGLILAPLLLPVMFSVISAPMLSPPQEGATRCSRF